MAQVRIWGLWNQAWPWGPHWKWSLLKILFLPLLLCPPQYIKIYISIEIDKLINTWIDRCVERWIYETELVSFICVYQKSAKFILKHSTCQMKNKARMKNVKWKNTNVISFLNEGFLIQTPLKWRRWGWQNF